jgi:hypothetical protein
MIAVIGTDWRVELPGRLRPNGHQARIKVAMRGKKKWSLISRQRPF